LCLKRIFLYCNTLVCCQGWSKRGNMYPTTPQIKTPLPGRLNTMNFFINWNLWKFQLYFSWSSCLRIP
jgi:hypothetical protein